MNKKILIVRLSSFGDIIQTMPVIDYLADEFVVDFLTKREFAQLPELSSRVNKVISFDKGSGLIGLVKLAIKLRNENYTHVYDAHNNIRSNIFLIFFYLFSHVILKQRSKDRFKRILLFKFRINKFPNPFRGIYSFINPVSSLVKDTKKIIGCDLKFKEQVKDRVDGLLNDFSDFVVFAPSAAWQMKRWPINHWKALAMILKDKKIVVLGGPADLFCQEIADLASERILNLAGKTNLIESAYVVKKASFCISADTGILHVADILNIRTLALIGPTAFGFPSSVNSKVCEVSLDCRPCTKDGRGKCTQDIYQKCMVEISPEMVAKELASFSAI